jgi:D-arabinose 1-dehydrogenase-like Zn-dependent alcohol dehydrogenase
LKAGGRMVIVGNVDPGNVPLNPAMAILKEIDFVGSAHATVADLTKVVELVARGAIAPDIADFVPIEEASRAHRMMEERKVNGRVVLLHADEG